MCLTGFVRPIKNVIQPYELPSPLKGQNLAKRTDKKPPGCDTDLKAHFSRSESFYSLWKITQNNVKLK